MSLFFLLMAHGPLTCPYSAGVFSFDTIQKRAWHQETELAVTSFTSYQTGYYIEAFSHPEKFRFLIAKDYEDGVTLKVIIENQSEGVKTSLNTDCNVHINEPLKGDL